MPVDPGNLFTGQITPDEIREFWVGDRSPRVDSFTYRMSNCRETFWIPASKDFAGGATDGTTKLKAFIQYALGIDYVQQIGSQFFLRRQVPMFHPIHTSLYCDAIISVNGVAPRGDDPNFWSESLQTVTPVKWDKYEVVVSFAIPKWKMRGDSQVTSEFQRYTSGKMIPSTQVIWIEQGMTTLDAPGAPQNNKPSIRSIGRREGCGILVYWYRVPAEWVHPTGGNLGFGVAKKMMQAQGRINMAPFDIGGETLPVESVQLMKVDMGDPYVMPLITDINGELNEIHDPYFAYDIAMYFEYFDPEPKGKTGETRHGWNFRIAQDLKFYFSRDETSGLTPFQQCNFSKLFTHYSNAFIINPDGSLS